MRRSRVIRPPNESADDAPAVHDLVRSGLLAGGDPTRGWGYYPAKRKRLEPTSWALLALGRSEPVPPALDILKQWQRRDALLVDLDGVPPNLAANAAAALVLLQDRATIPDAHHVIRRLIELEGLSSPNNDVVIQDNRLQGWPWVHGTSSWVEPTAMCVLVLKKYRARGSSEAVGGRIAAGEQMLFDRACRMGGWNYGNKNVFGRDLWPYVPTTALALLALQDRRSEPLVQRSLGQLQQDLHTERSGLALALALICLRAYGIPANDVERLLEDAAAAALEDSGNCSQLTLGAALYALADSGEPDAFKL